jgi:AcrR family transcriptional regulator
VSLSADIRERQAEVVRDAILDAVSDRLETTDPEDIAMPQVAADAGISLRTLYRYFSTREDLFDAVGDHVVARLGLPRAIDGPDDISRVFLESAASGASSPQLMRSIMASKLGGRIRSAHRHRRVAAMQSTLSELTSDLPPTEARARAGAIIYLASLPAWITVSEECGVSAEDARLGVAWAIDSLIATLRSANPTADQSPSIAP